MANRVIVIGAGASGMMAALTAAENGAQVMLFEKNDRPGKKILISGKGTIYYQTIERIAKEVIQGKWDNGDIRKQKLEAAGHNYAEIQNKVNELLG